MHFYSVTFKTFFLSVLVFAAFAVTARADAPDFSPEEAERTRPTSCEENYFKKIRPLITNQKLTKKTEHLCFHGFSVMHSGITRTPLWAAHHLTAAEIRSARGLDRQGEFRAEDRLPADQRAELEHYRGSDYDRGHLVPNGDMANRKQQYDSFSLANMIPQAPENNRVVWNNLEQALRGLVAQEQEAYVVTGGAFFDKKLDRLTLMPSSHPKKVEGTSLEKHLKQPDDTVLVPSHTFKAVYFPTRQAASAYWAPNDNTRRIQVISIAELDRCLGVRVFPNMPPTISNKWVKLPTGNDDELAESSCEFASQPIESSTAPAESIGQPEKELSPVKQDQQSSFLWLLLLALLPLVIKQIKKWFD